LSIIYPDSWYHLAEELESLLFLLRSQCLYKLQAPTKTAQFPGLHVSHEDAAAILQQPLNPLLLPGPLVPLQNPFDPDELTSAWQVSQPLVAQRRQTTRDQEICLSLDELTQAFALSRFEEQIILLSLLPELNPAVGLLFAYLQQDVNQTRPTAGLALEWLQPDFASWVQARASFDANAPLFATRLLHRQVVTVSILAQQLLLDERILRFLLGQNEADPVLDPFCRLERPGEAEGESHDAARLTMQSSLLAFLAEKPAEVRQVVYLQGRYGSGQLAMVKQVGQVLARPQLIVNSRFLSRSGDQFLNHLAHLGREARLQKAVLVFQDAEYFLAETEEETLLTLLAQATQSSDLVFLTGEGVWQPRGRVNQYPILTYRLDIPTEPERLSVWQAITQDAPLTPGLDLKEIAGRFRFTAGQIRDAWEMALNQARLRQPDQPLVTAQDLYAGAHSQSIHQLHTLAEIVPPVHVWNDLVLPPDTIAQLREFLARARHLHLVYQQWGFNQKLATNRGLSALFTGPSGTGKTMAASIIARELGLELYRIDLSAVVSKYVGETEKNLSRVFDEAWRSNAIIFFDEADALFGKRSEVRDSHDRYANIEVNYLLQRMDTFDGVVILASNLGQNIDDAFQRRLQFMVNFPPPEGEDRFRIWQRIWPPLAPLADDIDFRFLAEQFKFSGGNIRNIALQAAFLAAEAGETQITMRQLVASVMRELQKGGRLVSPRDFGPYADLLSEG